MRNSYEINSIFWFFGLLSSFAFLLGIWAFWHIKKITELKRKFFQGSDGTDLENALRVLDKHLLDLQDQHLVLEKNFIELKKKFNYSFQKMGVIKFNPFENGGGNLSFVLALLDAENSGILLTSMHGREHNRIYIKKVSHGKSDQQLTEEETMAIQNANSKF